jgi:cobalt-zinc-cadmium efflux system outer membrane protein
MDFDDMKTKQHAYQLRLLWTLLLLFGVTGCAIEDYKPTPVAGFIYDDVSFRSDRPQVDTDITPPRAESPKLQPAPEGTRAEHPAALSLKDAIAETLSSPAILSAAENVSQASAALWTASTPPNPMFNVSQTLNPLDRSFTPERQGGPPQFDAGISFPIDWLVFGKRSAAMDSAKLGADLAGAEFTNLVRQRLAATVASFFDALEAQELLALARLDVNNLEQIYALTQQQVQLGALASIEADRIHLAVLDGRREVQRRQTAAETAKAALRTALGRAADAGDFEIAGKLDIANVETPLSTEDALHLAEQYRPDLFATRLKINKAEADVRLEERKALPLVTPAVGYTHQFQKAIGYPDANSWGVGLLVSVPIFDRNQGAISKANSLLAQSRYDLENQLAQLRGEIAQATENFKLSHTFVTSDISARIAAAKSIFERIELAYKVGDRNLLEMLDAQRNYRDVMRSAVTDRAAYWRALHRLNAAIGKQILK